MPQETMTQEEVRRILNGGPMPSVRKEPERKPVAMSREVKSIAFTVPCKAVGAPRMTQSDKWNKRPCVVAYRSVKDAIRDKAPELPPADSVISLSWTAYFVPPMSWSVKKRAAAIGTRHQSKPDRDNIDKTILDALYDDDHKIASGTICKRWDVTARIDIILEYV